MHLHRAASAAVAYGSAHSIARIAVMTRQSSVRSRSEQADELTDSSAGIALKSMSDCREVLRGMYKNNARVRGSFIERDQGPAEKLRALVAGREAGAPGDGLE